MQQTDMIPFYSDTTLLSTSQFLHAFFYKKPSKGLIVPNVS